MIARHILPKNGHAPSVAELLTTFDFFNDFKDTASYLKTVSTDDGTRCGSELRRCAASTSSNLTAANNRFWRTHSDDYVAELQGWTTHKNSENGVTSYHKGEDRIWAASARRLYVRARYSEDRFSHHRSFDEFRDALQDKDGKNFGPTWNYEKTT